MNFHHFWEKEGRKFLKGSLRLPLRTICRNIHLRDSQCTPSGLVKDTGRLLWIFHFRVLLSDLAWTGKFPHFWCPSTPPVSPLNVIEWRWMKSCKLRLGLSYSGPGSGQGHRYCIHSKKRGTVGKVGVLLVWNPSFSIDDVFRWMCYVRRKTSEESKPITWRTQS